MDKDYNKLIKRIEQGSFPETIKIFSIVDIFWLRNRETLEELAGEFENIAKKAGISNEVTKEVWERLCNNIMDIALNEIKENR